MRFPSAADAAAQAREARRWHRDAWLIVLAIGCAIILFGNLLGIGPWWLASAVAGCMILFAVAVRVHVDDADVPADTKGDSIYYLGLLFTFAALVAALITFDWGAPGAGAGGTTGTIRNFGIALLTTIVGLAGRVWFTMSRESAGDIVDNTRSQLEETVALMKESLDRARDDLDILAHKFRDSAAGLAAMGETLAEGVRGTSETYMSLDAYAGYIAGATRSLTEQLNQLNAVCGSSARALTALRGRAERLAGRFGDVHARIGEAESRFGEVWDRFDRAGATLDGMNEAAGSAAKRIDAALRGIEGTDVAVSSLGDTLSGVRNSADRARDALAGIADAVDGHEVLPTWKGAVDQLGEGTRGIRAIGRRAAEMNEEFEGLRASLRAARAGLAAVPETAGAIDRLLREAGPELRESITPIRNLAHDLNGDLEAAGRRSHDLAGALRDATTQARDLSRDLREAAGGAVSPPRPRPVDRLRRAVAGTWRALGRLAELRRKL